MCDQTEWTNGGNEYFRILDQSCEASMHERREMRESFAGKESSRTTVDHKDSMQQR